MNRVGFLPQFPWQVSWKKRGAEIPKAEIGNRPVKRHELLAEEIHMVECREEFSRYLNRSGRKGAAKSYPSYLSSASTKLGITIGPSTVSCPADVEDIRSRLEREGTTTRVDNCVSALRAYHEFVNGSPLQKSPKQQDSEPTSQEDARQRTIAAIVRRQGQPEFRNKLIRAYEGQCAITGCTAREALEAAHIEPYMGKSTNVVANGLLLRADIHTLFDRGYISVDAQSMSVIVDTKLEGTEYAELRGRRIFKPRSKADRPNRKALEKHSQWAVGTRDAPTIDTRP